jgi:exopolysaccharide biosynthesis protein
LPAQSKNINEDDAKTNTIKYGDNIYSYNFIITNNVHNIVLITNYEHKNSSSEILDSNSCKYLTSSGFYSKNDKPIGLLINNYKVINKSQDNQLFNGFLTLNSFDTPIISTKIPDEGSRISIQSGPVLIENSYTKELSIKNDNNARRVVAGVTGSNELIFIVIYNNLSAFDGPQLSDLPNIIELISLENDLNIADAINLDGGSASSFYKDDIILRELTNVGSFFCIKD